MTTNPANLLTIKEVADRLHVSTGTVYNLVRSDRIASVKIGKSRRFTTEAVERFVVESVATTDG